MDVRVSAETAKYDIDGKIVRQHTLRVRFPARGPALKVRNLSKFVTNELLELIFAVFGKITKAVHLVNKNGQPSGEGIIEFEQEDTLTFANNFCQQACVFPCNSPAPIITELLEKEEESEVGWSEGSLEKDDHYNSERERGPRFGGEEHSEYNYGIKIKN